MEHRGFGAIALVAMIAVGLLGVRSAAHSPLGGQTCRFFRYWEAYDNSELKLQWWERIAYSLVQAGADMQAGGEGHQHDPKS